MYILTYVYLFSNLFLHLRDPHMANKYSRPPRSPKLHKAQNTKAELLFSRSYICDRAVHLWRASGRKTSGGHLLTFVGAATGKKVWK